ncbi:hypothetical protein MEY_05504, partial [Candida albicans 19F]
MKSNTKSTPPCFYPPPLPFLMGY